MTDDRIGSRLATLLHTLEPKTKQPASVTVLNNWIVQAEGKLDPEAKGGRLGWQAARRAGLELFQWHAVMVDAYSPNVGLDAYVACTCYRDGLASAPPVERDRLEIGEGGDVMLRDSPPMEEWRELDEWQRTACAHPDMTLVHERVGNIAGISALRCAFAVVDRDTYPRLSSIVAGLSGLMDECLPADHARLALREIDALLAQDVIGPSRIICDIDGAMVDAHVDWDVDGGDVRSLDPPGTSSPPQDGLVEIGVRGYQFVVGTRDNQPRELLTARLLEQRWDFDNCGPVDTQGGTTSLVKFTNVETGQSICVCSYGLYQHFWMPAENSFGRRYPEMLYVSTRMVMVAEVWHKLDVLRRLFDAAARSGNPVVWC